MPSKTPAIPLFEWEFEEKTLNIFPPEIARNPYMVYHGTSLVHSTNIETSGFKIDYQPVEKDRVFALVKSLDSFGHISDYKSGEMFTTLNDIGLVEQYLLEVRSISFSPVSYVAATYAANFKGGLLLSKLSFLSNLLIEEIQAGQLENKLSSELLNARFIKARCEEIRNTEGVIYAIEVDDNLKSLLYSNIGVIYSRADIPLLAIKGKMIIPIGFQPPQIPNRVIQELLFFKASRSPGISYDLDI